MMNNSKSIIKNLAKRVGISQDNSLIGSFHSQHYLRHNARRLEHLASLHLPVAGLSVLEVGAGIGDHSHYFIDRGCRITITDSRSDNIRYLRAHYPDCDVQFLDMEHPSSIKGSPFAIVYCYGLLYHLTNPEQALEFLGKQTSKMLLLETCVSFGQTEETNIVKEDQYNPTQASSGFGCRPTRPWLFKKLKMLFEYVYLPKTQPNHEEFPLDWTAPEKHHASLQRAIFIASREKLANESLTLSLINIQTRHE
jgi:hypothetical protein